MAAMRACIAAHNACRGEALGCADGPCGNGGMDGLIPHTSPDNVIEWGALIHYGDCGIDVFHDSVVIQEASQAPHVAPSSPRAGVRMGLVVAGALGKVTE